MMQPVVSTGWKKWVALVCMTVSSAYALAADPAGSVSFVIGDASVVGEDGKARAVARGENINAGQLLETGATGHIHLRMVDGAFVSIRPQSRLRIEDYRYDAGNPENNRIKFVLEKGVARSITGRAGEASRQNYRLNTPLAAIGIRGTDFVVQANADITRVTVQSGAVVMTPLAADCLASSLGPCKSAASRVLTAAMRDAYLELRNRNEAPLLVPAEKALESSPNTVAPPRPEEPRATADKQAKPANNVDTRDAVREVAAADIKNRVETPTATPVPEVTPPAPEPTPPITSIPPPVEPPPVVVEPARFWWGRYSPYVQAGQEHTSFNAVNQPGREPFFGNAVFSLFRESGTLVVPNSGVAKFKLVESEAIVMTGNQLAAAQITSPSLTIDFAQRRFDTSLTVNSDGIAPVSIASSGEVTHQGLLLGKTNTPDTKLNGLLSDGGGQAAYVFERALSGNQSIQGVTRWTR
ncbi:FecR family protein [Noviherbaspirillum saxi]|uniref:FecR protein domain-containing protein n=1 Tax=Noviherbaspirillum saxi TaxID=2320863 RepID=A0A3A3FVZ6_9BURK|nr:FecR domain-containing protein [Noviherbaspirillum saxi]RJF99494.1 hypothetical protein D3871_13885 [Noviherbaspirillum saxi]